MPSRRVHAVRTSTDPVASMNTSNPPHGHDIKAVTPGARMVAQNWGRARRHRGQCPQAIMLSSATRSRPPAR
jgi:hypothetical protein